MEPQGVGVQGTRVQGLGFYIRDDIRSGPTRISGLL